ncbi:MAG: hypothetical protein HFE85_00260 [Clostridiales bacterium]|nr:hypothetical protein [Clostridiales bacterium]
MIKKTEKMSEQKGLTEAAFLQQMWRKVLGKIQTVLDESTQRELTLKEASEIVSMLERVQKLGASFQDEGQDPLQEFVKALRCVKEEFTHGV